MGKTNRKNQRGPKNVDLNPNPGASDEEQGTDNIGNVAEEPKAETKPTQKPRRDRHPIFDHFFTTLRYDQQIVALTAATKGLEVATQERADLLIDRVSRQQMDGERVGRNMLRELRLAELATDLETSQRTMLMGPDGLEIEEEEAFVLRLTQVANDALKGAALRIVTGDLTRLLGEVRDYKSWAERKHREEEQQRELAAARNVEIGDDGGKVFKDPADKPTTLNDIAGEELQKTGTEG